MFLFSPNHREIDVELDVLNDLNLPPAENSTYTSCYCEENVWKLCDYVKNHQPNLMQFCYAVFISNRNQTVPLWCQKSGRTGDKLAVWDYHVIFIYHPLNNSMAWVYDLDSTVPYPVEFANYASSTFKVDSLIEACCHRYFRVVPSETFLKTFASDRSRMKKSDGTWMAAPPGYPCIFTAESTNNLDDFISMNPDKGVGEVMNLGQFTQQFLSCI